MTPEFLVAIVFAIVLVATPILLAGFLRSRKRVSGGAR